MTIKTKTCSKCHKTKPLNEFYNDKSKKDSKDSQCKECRKKYCAEQHEKVKESQRKHHEKYREKINKRQRKYYWNHREEKAKRSKKWYENGGREKQGYQSMYKNKSCSNYLGIVIGERLCRYLFKDVKVMPYGNPGFDIICNKGKKIDVKTASTTLIDVKNSRWKFHIDENKIADFFILVAFDNRTDLNPIHLWMIPGKELNDQGSASIALSTIHKWDKYKKDIKDAKLCCAEMKNHDKITSKSI